jgi:tetratricopeptide (TPR) repeat protein
MSNPGSGDLATLQSAPREVARWQKAQQQLTSGRYSHALAAYRELVQNHPAIAQLWFEMGIAAGGDLDFTLAHQAFQTSISLAPDDSSLLVLIGQQYQRLRQLEHARACFERAVAAEPDSIHARLSLAAWFERERRVDDAWECVAECLARKPLDASALYFRAFLLHRRGRNAEAAEALRSLIATGIPDPNLKSSSTHLLGVVLDELGEYAEAFRWLRDAKGQLHHTNNTLLLQKTYDQTDRQRRALLAALKPADIQRWRQEGPAEGGPRRLVFLGGHPRSGTTLVEQILGAHPEIMAFDEPEAFTMEVVNEVAPTQSTRGLTLDGLNALSAATRANLRRRYLRSLLREVPGEAGSRVLVDKNPSPTASLHLWLRVFPELKVIIPLRDPRDVVISCFFQNLSLTSANVNFLSLEGTARHFADQMDVWLRMKELGGFDWLETRYEDVVKDLAGEGRRITEFIGLPWDPQQEKYYETARRKFVFAPTYHEVTKPVHNRAIGRWEHYTDALQPVMGRLERYCKAFGYG